MCWNSNISVQRNNVKKTVEQLVFRLFWILTRKTCVFAWKFLAGLSKLLSTCPVEHLQINISEWKSWKLEDFRIIFENFGTMAENLFRGRQNSNRCPREKFMEFFFQKRKIRNFFRFWANVYFQRKFLPDLRSPQSMSPWKFSGKNIFWNVYNLSHFSGIWSKKRLVGKKIFSRFVTTAIRASRYIIWEKVIFLKKSVICPSVLEFEQFFLSIDKKQSGFQTNNLLIQKNVGWKKMWKIFSFLNHFWISSRKIWTISQKILAGLSKLHSKSSEEHF